MIRFLDGLCCVVSALVGGFMLWLGGTALIVGAACWFMAGGFFQRVMTRTGAVP
jgi:membrane protein implicated in regulation of membrane protease activity